MWADNMPQILTVSIVFAIAATMGWLAVTARMTAALAKASRLRTALERANERIAALNRDNALLKRDIGKLLAENEQLSGHMIAQQDERQTRLNSDPSSFPFLPKTGDMRIVFRRAPGESDAAHEPTGEHIDTSI